MNKTELIDAIAAHSGVADKKTAAAVLEATLTEIQNAVTKGDKVSLTGFGVFEKRARAARMARNPRTGEAVKVKKTSVPAFRPGAGFKDTVAVGKVAGAAKKAGAKSAPGKKATSKPTATKPTAAKSAPAKKAATKATTAAKAAPAKAAKKTVTAKTAAAKKTVTAKTAAKAAPKKTAAKATAKKAATKTTTKAAAKKAPAKKAAKR